MLLAVKLHEIGRLTVEQAAELAGMSKEAFMEALSKYRAPVSAHPSEELRKTVEERKTTLVSSLAKIPLETWNRIVRMEPEWRNMSGFPERYGFGKFAVLMLTLGLNDFQLKGKAEVAYWPKLKELLEEHGVPESPKDLELILSGFYRNERLPELKLRRLNRFLSSGLARKLWNVNSSEAARDFLRIWYELARTMGQSKDAKTIAFAMKCLGIALLMVGEVDFDFERIPIPVDYRIKAFTKRLGLSPAEDDEVREFWGEVLDELRRRVHINMIHLDSLIWQIGTLSGSGILEYFAQLGLREVGEEIAEAVG